MKRSLFIATMIMVCLITLFGCTQNISEDNTQGEYCRVVCIKEDGIIVDIEYVGYVYVKNINQNLKFKILDTVVMEFSESDLKSEGGTFINFDGKELRYSYVLGSIKSIRLAKPSIGEPTFG